LDIPPPPSPADGNNTNLSSFPSVSDERKKSILPPMFGGEKFGVSSTSEFESLDQDWKQFAKLGIEPELNILKPELEVKPEATGVLKTSRMMVGSPNQLENTSAPPFHQVRVYASSPLFIEADSYSRFHLLGGVVAKIEELREKEDMELKRWHQNTDEIRRKLLFIDDALFESRG
jgi:hypothetical protein